MLPRALRNTRDGLLGLALPEQCRVCGGTVESWDDGVACAECWDDRVVTKLLNGSVCHKCGTPTRVPAGSDRGRPPAETLCGMCSSLPFTASRACGVYSGALEASILFLKVHPYICTRLRRIICRTFSEHHQALASEIVMPLPLHHSREKQRGFNQAAIIAKIISREFDLLLDDRSLVRARPTERHRAGMDAADRARSVERAFEVARPRAVEGASILLVDDVHTTGSTICAASECLLKAGAGRITVLTISRVGDARTGQS